MLSVSANCTTIRQSFGHKNEKAHTSGLYDDELLDDITLTANTLKDKNVSDEDKAKSLQSLSKKASKNSSGPLNVIIASIGMGGAGFLIGRKLFGKKVLNVLDKNTKTLDKMSAWVDKKITKLKNMEPSEEKTLKGFVSRKAKGFVEWYDKFSQKGLTPEELAKIQNDPKKAVLLAKNAVKNTVRNIGGLLGMGTGAGEVAKDKDNNGKSDLLEKTSELSTFGRVTKLVDTVDAATSLMS